jgi:hypothetical protein
VVDIDAATCETLHGDHSDANALSMQVRGIDEALGKADYRWIQVFVPASATASLDAKKPRRAIASAQDGERDEKRKAEYK